MNYHDFEVTGLNYDQENLSLEAKSPEGSKVKLQFISVSGWDLSPFQEQNVLFAIEEYAKIPDWILEEYNPPQEYLSLIDSHEKKLFYLNPSVGLGGYIIAKELTQA